MRRTVHKEFTNLWDYPVQSSQSVRCRSLAQLKVDNDRREGQRLGVDGGRIQTSAIFPKAWVGQSNKQALYLLVPYWQRRSRIWTVLFLGVVPGNFRTTPWQTPNRKTNTRVSA